MAIQPKSNFMNINAFVTHDKMYRFIYGDILIFIFSQRLPLTNQWNLLKEHNLLGIEFFQEHNLAVEICDKNLSK